MLNLGVPLDTWCGHLITFQQATEKRFILPLNEDLSLPRLPLLASSTKRSLKPSKQLGEGLHVQNRTLSSKGTKESLNLPTLNHTASQIPTALFPKQRRN